MARIFRRVKKCLAESRMAKLFPLLFVATVILGFAVPASAQLYYQQSNLLARALGNTNGIDPYIVGSWSLLARSPGSSPWLVNSLIGGVSVSFNAADINAPVLATIQLPQRQGSSAIIGIVFWYE